MSASAPLLEVRDLVVEFRSPRAMLSRSSSALRAVDGVSFAMERGQSLGLVGESGSGKSTIGRAIAGLTRPASGNILLAGEDITFRRGAARRGLARRIQLVFQDPLTSLDPRRRVGWQIAEILRVHGLASARQAPTRVGAMLERVGLAPELAGRFPHELSGGQRQRIAIARALAPNPELLICDEPTAALDVTVQAQILALLEDLRRAEGLACLFISHDLAVVGRMCASIVVLQQGRSVEIGSVEDVLGEPRHPCTRRLVEIARSTDAAIDAGGSVAPATTSAARLG